MSEAPIERVNRPSYADFRRHYLEPNKPALITSAMDSWPAMQRWSFDHVGEVLAGRKITPVVLDKGNFHMRGYTGDDKPDHCAHIGLMADIVRVHLASRWKSPKGRK